MNHHAQNRSNGSGWRQTLAFLGFAAIAAFFLLSEHRMHLLGILPWMLLLLVCPLLHMTMHGGHGGASGDGAASGQDRENPPPAADAGAHRH